MVNTQILIKEFQFSKNKINNFAFTNTNECIKKNSIFVFILTYVNSSFVSNINDNKN